MVAVWAKKKPLADSYDEVYRTKAFDLDTPDPGQINTSRGGWNGGTQGWLMRNSLLLTSGLSPQNYFRVDLYTGTVKIASGEFSVRSGGLKK